MIVQDMIGQVDWAMLDDLVPADDYEVVERNGKIEWLGYAYKLQWQLLLSNPVPLAPLTEVKGSMACPARAYLAWLAAPHARQDECFYWLMPEVKRRARDDKLVVQLIKLGFGTTTVRGLGAQGRRHWGGATGEAPPGKAPPGKAPPGWRQGGAPGWRH